MGVADLRNNRSTVLHRTVLCAADVGVAGLRWLCVLHATPKANIMATASPRSGVLRTFSEKIFKSPRSWKGKSRKDELGRTGFNRDAISLNAVTKFGSANAKVVVAIDFGTTYSGYAYAFTSTPDEIHLMRKVDPAGQFGSLMAHKNPTILLLNDKGGFHSFGFDAREAYHDLDEVESRNWLYFEKFKMELHSRRVSSQKHKHNGFGP